MTAKQKPCYHRIWALQSQWPSASHIWHLVWPTPQSLWPQAGQVFSKTGYNERNLPGIPDPCVPGALTQGQRSHFKGLQRDSVLTYMHNSASVCEHLLGISYGLSMENICLPVYWGRSQGVECKAAAPGQVQGSTLHVPRGDFDFQDTQKGSQKKGLLSYVMLTEGKCTCKAIHSHSLPTKLPDAFAVTPFLLCSPLVFHFTPILPEQKLWALTHSQGAVMNPSSPLCPVSERNFKTAPPELILLVSLVL